MKDEIKEILEKPNVYSFNDECYLYFGDYNKLKDYITNLQQENERLKENLQQEKKDFKEANDYCFELKDYKSRCEKAVEYIGNNVHYYPTTKYGEGFAIDNENEEEFCNDLLNILQNGDEEK